MSRPPPAPPPRAPRGVSRHTFTTPIEIPIPWGYYESAVTRLAVVRCADHAGASGLYGWTIDIIGMLDRLTTPEKHLMDDVALAVGRST